MLRSFVEVLPFQSFQLLFTTKFYKLITGSLVSAILILPVTFAPLTSFHASKWGAGHLKGFSSFGPYRENSSSLAKYALTICYYRTFTLLYFELCLSVIQAGNQSIHTRPAFFFGPWIGKNAGQNDNLLHEGKASEWCFHWSSRSQFLLISGFCQQVVCGMPLQAFWWEK